MITIEDLTQESAAKQVGDFWELASQDKISQVNKWDEVRKFVFATDTSATTAESTPWNNRTTRPKLTWIRDQLVVHLMSALFPNDEFFRWHGHPHENEQVAPAITRIMKHKLRNPHVKFRETMGQILADYIETGNCFAGVEYIEVKAKALKDGGEINVFRGARPYRIDPRRAVLDPHAIRFDDSSFAYRTIQRRDIFFKNASNKYRRDVIEKINRLQATTEFPKDIVDALDEQNISIDGVNTSEFWSSGRIEIIEYYGSVFDGEEFAHNRHIVIADRRWVLLDEEIDTLMGIKPVVFSSYRKRPENLWGMGPLENLIGMQYRNDHLENAKADGLDLSIYPIKVVTGDATEEEYPIQPGAEWHVSSQGKVELLYPDPRTILFDSQIQNYEMSMEMFAGIPREQAGFRTPGEKTQYEVQQLLALSDQPFAEKLKNFESQFLEPLLNLIWELTMRNFSEQDIKSMSEEDQAVISSLDPDDLKVDGRFFPVGSKHFIERQEKKQKIMELVTIGLQIAPEHTAKLRALQVLQMESNLEEEKIIDLGAGLVEQAQTEAAKAEIDNQFKADNPNAQITPSESLGNTQALAAGGTRSAGQ